VSIHGSSCDVTLLRLWGAMGCWVMTVHRAVNSFLEIPPGTRRDLTTPELETVLPELDAIGHGG
jgi:hypothetical protein